MSKINADRLNEILNGIKDVHIAVVGDLMLDRYLWGKVDRISPEAPVPVVALDGESSSLGGAANVASNVAALGAKVTLYGLIGDDNEGKIVCDLIQLRNFGVEGIIKEANRMTSVKTRVIAQSQHLVRIDRETIRYIDDDSANRLLNEFELNIKNFNAVILQDYNKGTLSPTVIKRIIEIANSAKVPVGVDPKRENFWVYENAFLFKPNLKELENALNRVLSDDFALEIGSKTTLERLRVKNLLVTRGEKGMMLYSESGSKHIPTQAHRVHDVSGAGDTVIATMMSAIAGGAEIEEAAVLANYAASVVIAEVGAVPVNPVKLRRAVLGN